VAYKSIQQHKSQFIQIIEYAKDFINTQYEAFPDLTNSNNTHYRAGTGADVATALNLNPHVVILSVEIIQRL